MDLTAPSQSTLYKELAFQIQSQIEKGLFKSGEKIPSLRTISTRHGVSLNTAKEAYILLETQGFLESRPQSGFFVRRLAPPLEAKPKDRHPMVADPRVVSICSVYGSIMEAGNFDDGMAPLAVAHPDPALLPTSGLDQAFRKAFQIYPRQTGDYLMSPGWKPLREALSKRLLAAGAEVTPDQILITQGASEALFLAVSHLCRPGDTVAVESPTYFNFLHLLELLGLKVLEIPSDPQEGMNLAVLKYALKTSPVRAVISITNFSNPLGASLPEGKKKELTEFLDAQGIPLIEDDTYGELAYHGPRPGTCKAWDKTGNVLLCGSLSKTLSPGLRVGWLVPGRFQAELERRKTLTNISTGSVNQIAAGLYLSEGGYDRHLKRLVSRLSWQGAEIRELIAQCFPPGTRVSRPGGGLVLWAEIPGGRDTNLLYQRGLKEGVLFAPGQAFTATDDFSHCLRINAGFWSPVAKTHLQQLGQWLRDM